MAIFNDRQLIKLKKEYLVTILFFYLENIIINDIDTINKKYKNYNANIRCIKWDDYKGSIEPLCIPAFCFYKGEREETIYTDDMDYIEGKIKNFIGGID